MHTGDGIPAVTMEARLSDALMEMTRTRLGMTAIVDGQQKVLGIFTDGDLRRHLRAGGDIMGKRIRTVMTREISWGERSLNSRLWLGLSMITS